MQPLHHAPKTPGAPEARDGEQFFGTKPSASHSAEVMDSNSTKRNETAPQHTVWNTQYRLNTSPVWTHFAGWDFSCKVSPCQSPDHSLPRRDLITAPSASWRKQTWSYDLSWKATFISIKHHVTPRLSPRTQIISAPFAYPATGSAGAWTTCDDFQIPLPQPAYLWSLSTTLYYCYNFWQYLKYNQELPRRSQRRGITIKRCLG